MSNVNKFKVLIDAKKIDDGGIGASLRNLIEGLLMSRGIEVSLLGDKEKIGKYVWSNLVNLIEDNSKPYSLKESFWISKKIDFSNYDIFHTPHYTLPFKISIPSVATVHDIIHITHPRKFYYPFIAKIWINSTLKRASKIITVSEASKSALIKNFKYANENQDKIVVVPNAVSLRSVNEDEMQSKAEFSFNYLIAVFSNTMPHKGLEDLLWAYKKLEERFSKQNLPKLVLVGYGIQRLLESGEMKNFDISENVKVLGAVSNKRLTLLILNAKAMLVPSLAEGFYIPAIDAQSLGVPFICRPVPAICELLANNDFCAKSMSKEDFFEVIKNFLQLSFESGINYKLNEKRLEKYKIENVILKVLDVYSELTGKEIERPSIRPSKEASKEESLRETKAIA